jgi:hypothetical protein
MFTLWEKVYLASLIFLQRSVVPLVTPSKFTHNDDYLIMEDESGRVKLIRDANLPSFYVTGVVVAVCGKEEKDGEFFVQEILEPGLPPQIPLPSAVSFGKEICFFGVWEFMIWLLQPLNIYENFYRERFFTCMLSVILPYQLS